MKPIVLRIDEKAVLPTKRFEDSGYDLCAIFNSPVVIQKPFEMKIFKTGLKMRFPTTHTAFIKERGSTRLYNLNVGAGVVEGNYSGEYMIMATNLNEYIDILYVNDYDFNDIKTAMHEAYPHYGWLTETPERHLITVDDFGRTVLLRVGVYSPEDNEVLAYIYQQKKAIAQMVLLRKEDWVFREVEEAEFDSIYTERGDGKFGSSGK